MELDSPSGQARLAACINMLTDLREEISAAMDCIARDALGEFELSLWRQEMLCAVLKRVIDSSAPAVVDRKMREGLREHAVALKSQSQKYEMVIRECSPSMSILRDLCHLYGHARELSQNTSVPCISCEV